MRAASSLNISTAQEYKAFLDNVNSGNNYLDQTIYLINDLDLKVLGTLNPIGKDINTPFFGEFDGQGHTISNLRIESQGYHLGMFGASDNGYTVGGVTIKNVILDASCSVSTTEISYTTGWFFIAGFLGSCSGFTHECRVEGCVNMATVTHAENVSKSAVTLGGIIGGCSGSIGGCTVENCINYGDIVIKGVSSFSYIAGIAGYLRATTPNCFVKSCVNYGKLVNNGLPSECLYVGGFVGFAYNGTTTQNSLNFGTKVEGTVGPNAADYVFFAGAFGYGQAGSTVTQSYWRSDIWGGAIGRNKGGAEVQCSGFNPTTLKLDSDGSLLSEAMKDNGFSALYKLSFELNGGTFNDPQINPRLYVSSHLSIPEPVKGDTVFCGWCSDPNLTDYVDISTVEPGKGVKLYAKWYHTVLFVSDNGEEIESVNSEVGKNVTFPELERTGHRFLGWRMATEPEIGTVYSAKSSFTVPNSEVTFVAVFETIKYKLYFYNWDETLVENGVVEVPFGTLVNSSIFTETVPEKTGFVFNKWVVLEGEGAEGGDENSTVKADFEATGEFVMPARNVTFVAHFISNTVKIVFESKVVGSEIEVAISRFIDPESYIIKTIEEGDGSSYAIIVFKDADTAQKFFRSSDEILGDIVAAISFMEAQSVPEPEVSLAAQNAPFLCIFLVFALIKSICNR